MKDRPILMRGEMVRAILNGRKTQTRRIIKPQPIQGSAFPPASVPGDWSWARGKGGHCFTVSNSPNGPSDIADDCPYGRPGDTLWVRETWGNTAEFFDPKPCAAGRVIYKADTGHGPTGCHGDAWRPSIHMPREFCRLHLEIVGVRAERVQDISERDCEAEGITPIVPPARTPFAPMQVKAAYATLWDSINGKGSWGKNPWVWVVEFKRA